MTKTNSEHSPILCWPLTPTLILVNTPTSAMAQDVTLLEREVDKRAAAKQYSDSG